MTINSDGLLTPDKILNDYKSKKVDKERTVYILRTLLEKSDDVSIQLSCIEALAFIKPSNEEMFNILESCIVSGEDQFLREKSVQILYKLFPIKSLPILGWAIQHENTSFVLNSLFKLSKQMDGSHLSQIRSIRKMIIRRLSEFYGVVPDEIPFYLELNTLLDKVGTKLTRRRFEIWESDFLSRRYYITNLYYSCRGGAVYVVHNKRTRALIIPLSIKVPDSLSNLMRLKYLSLVNLESIPKALNSLRRLYGLELRVKKGKKLKFPDGIVNMRSLRELHLDRTFFTPISKLFIKLVKQNIAPKYVKEGITPEDAVNLGLLDVYFRQWIPSERYFGDYNLKYGADEGGHVISINFAGAHEFYSVDLASIPEPIFRFKFLENLRIDRNFICYISPKIKRLRNLKILDASSNPITMIPKSLAKLKNLEKADFSETKIREIPEELKSLKALNVSYGDSWDI